MALVKANTYAIGDVNLTNLMEVLDKTRRMGVSLTNYDNDLEPQIKAGSIFDFAGTMIVADEDTAVEGGSAIADKAYCYIRIYFDNGLYKAEFTDKQPVWSAIYQGFYTSDQQKRYIGPENTAFFTACKVSGEYQLKGIINQESLYSIQSGYIRRKQPLFHANSVTQDQIFDFLKDIIPSVDDEISIGGSGGGSEIDSASNTGYWHVVVFSKAIRITSSRIDLYGFRYKTESPTTGGWQERDTSVVTYSANDGSSAVFIGAVLSRCGVSIAYG